MVCGQCGNLRSECSDPSIDWHPRTSECYATATRDWGVRRLRDRFKDAKPLPSAMHPLDGLSVWVSQQPPAEGEDQFA